MTDRQFLLKKLSYDNDSFTTDTNYNRMQNGNQKENSAQKEKN